ncbi:MAG: hypothetical protein ACT4P7_20525, partial [Gemmatimonadaceae bacterium]
AVNTDTIGAIIAGIEQKDSMRRRQVATLGRLRITATDGARLTVNGLEVGASEWSADTLKPANYTLRASIPAPEGCESAADVEHVQLRAGAVRNVRLDVRSCGTLQITPLNNPVPSGLRYVVSGEPGVRKSGSLPLVDGGLVLPTGLYDLRVTADKPCQDYEQQVQIFAERTAAPRFRLLCDAADARERNR